MASTGEPSTWPAFAVWVILHPIVWLTALALVFLFYLLLRKHGFDPLPPLFARIGINTIGETTDISGKWKYRCTVISVDRQWGGTCDIEQTSTPYGIGWKLHGHRRWTKNSALPTTPLAAAFYWEPQWGAITDRSTMRFTYSIATNSGNVEGYAYGDIKVVDGAPKAIDGKFYQLPPFEPVHGIIEFRRMSNDEDTVWT